MQADNILIAEKLDQAVAILNELEIDLWLTLCGKHRCSRIRRWNLSLAVIAPGSLPFCQPEWGKNRACRPF
jgi:hypothetical protein